MSETRVVVLLGSLRAASLNKRIAETLREQAPAGTIVEIAEGLGDLPFYNEEIDTDVDVPAAAARLRTQVAGADRVLAVTPEYNGTMPAVLNNAIDWLSRPYGANALRGKPFAALGATPTRFGGKWSHEDARRSATVAGAHVIADIAISESTVDRGDILADHEFVGRLLGALDTLVSHRQETAPAA
ncbi:NAD(P)H-dependent oxidoreductase [Nocardioides agariphilus]|jgi:NAD(P)H-dependent FMN reductase|uniref:NAD(P)H-dependent oxidoreductase n=1 Tax=Nocardioides agariphilus TaxID=433664 RepID=A0A930YJC3_9ACTN|nr:NAD(P)H-dependent oxidoreductase [Nocardioides agariphilus]MBF4769122.1 NAD(P)H-dependent oxidoreductase [Nocardioides agariphilus]